MSQPFPLATLASMPEPVLSVYLATNPLRHLNRNCDHGCSRWFASHAKQLASETDSKEQRPLLRQIVRVKHFLRESLPEARGIALFAGPDTWHMIPLPREPENEIAWGKPSLWQLIVIAQAQQARCVATVEGRGARLFSFQFGELTSLATLDFHVDPSHWKQMQAFHSAERNAGMAHGAQHDLFERRYDTQYLRFLGNVAQRMVRTCDKFGLKQVLLLGPSRSIGILERKLSPSLQKQTILIPRIMQRPDSIVSLSKLVEAAMQDFEAHRQAKKLAELGERGHPVVTGAEETLAMLQRGRLSLLMAEESFNPLVRYCRACDSVRATGMECPRCQGPMVECTLRAILPQLLIRHSCECQLVSGRAAEPLDKLGGMGGWLRQKPELSAPRRRMQPGAAHLIAAGAA